MDSKVTTVSLGQKKVKGEKISMLTAYDYSTAKMLDQAGVDIALVGDSLGMVVLGYETTLPVTMEDMLRHTAAVSRAVERAMVVGDMPFMSYQISPEEALRNAGRFLQEANADAVKLEGGEEVADTIRRMVETGIPVMGHIGFTPQSIRNIGGFRVQGKTEWSAQRLFRDAQALEDAGAFAIVLELIPQDLAREITQAVSVPTLGIGAGPHCDGQVQVSNDILGLFTEFLPRHAKRYAHLSEQIKSAFESYVEEVKSGQFPGPEQSSS